MNASHLPRLLDRRYGEDPLSWGGSSSLPRRRRGRGHNRYLWWPSTDLKLEYPLNLTLASNLGTSSRKDEKAASKAKKAVQGLWRKIRRSTKLAKVQGQFQLLTLPYLNTLFGLVISGKLQHLFGVNDFRSQSKYWQKFSLSFYVIM